MTGPRRLVFLGLLIAAVAWAVPGRGQNSTSTGTGASVAARNGEWRAYGAVEGSTRYSPLDQITRENVKGLQVAWTFKFDNYGGTFGEMGNTEATPIMVNG